MKATIKNPDSRINGRAHRREQHFHSEYVALRRSTGRPVVTLRLYVSPHRAAYACLWVNVNPCKQHPTGLHANGSSRATGYGYHKPSAAAQGAIEAAGFRLDSSIDGGGDDAIQDAVHALAVAVGCKRPIIHKAHA